MDTGKNRIVGKNTKRALKSTLFAVLLSVFLSFEGLAAMTADGPGAAYESVKENTEDTASTEDAQFAKELITEGPISMDVVYGYDNVAKSGRFLPLDIQLGNDQETDFNGVLTVTSREPDYDGYSNSSQVKYDAYRYEFPVTIEANGSLEKKLNISLSSHSDVMYISLYDENEKQVLNKRLKMDLNTQIAQLFIGVLSDAPQKLSYLDQVGVNYSMLRTRTIDLTVYDLPDTELGLDQLDVLLITDFNTQALTQEQTDAILEWVHRGGILLLGTGDRGKETLSAFSKQLLEYPVQPASLYHLHMGADRGIKDRVDDELILNCTEVNLKGGTDLLTSDSFTVLSSTTMGNGMAAAAIFDFTDLEEYCSKDSSYIDHFLTALLGEDRINNLNSNAGGGNYNQFWSVQSLVNTGNIRKLPKIGFYVVLAVAYVALAGPGLYFFLKQRKLQEYYQPSVALLAVCTTGMVILMGSGTRFSGPFFTYATIESTGDTDKTETTFINMRAPYNKTYSVGLNPRYRLYPVTGSPYYDQTPTGEFTDTDKADVIIRYGEDATWIQAVDTGAFNSKIFQMETHTDNETGEGFSGELRAFNGELSGTLTNNYPYAVENAAVLLYNQLLIIGNMEPGETISLDNQPMTFCATNFSYALASQITGVSLYDMSGDMEDASYVQALERANLLSFYIENYISGYHSQACVVAFGDGEENLDFMQQADYEAYGCTLLTAQLEVNYEKGGKTYRSAMQKQPNVLSGEYDAARNTMYGMSPVILEYYLGNETEVDSVDFHPLTADASDSLKYYYTVPFSGSMYFYNYNTGDYDLIRSDQTHFTQEELEKYLSPGNTITVRYVYDTTGEYTWNIMLPVVTVTGRSK